MLRRIVSESPDFAGFSEYDFIMLKRTVSRYYRLILRNCPSASTRLCTISPENYVAAAIEKLHFENEDDRLAVAAMACDLIGQLHEKHLLPGSPKVLAAACLYIAGLLYYAQTKLCQREVAEVLGVGEPPLRERYKFIVRNLHLKFPESPGYHALSELVKLKS